MPRLYVVAPHEFHHPTLGGFLQEAVDLLRAEGKLVGWTIKTFSGSFENTFNPADVFSAVNSDPGPILVLGSLKAGAVAGLQKRAAERVPLARVGEVTDAIDCYQGITQCIESFDSGEPLISKRLLVTVQILTKLKRMDKWGGESMNKAYLYMEDLPNGGMHQSVQGIAIETAYELVNRGILKSKPSNGRKKVALNAERREQIEELLRLEVVDPSLQKFLAGGPGTISARHLDQYVRS